MIQIINGFKINAKNPIDSRIIVADDATRLAIQYKYHGLRVWQTNTNTPYFWDGTDWKSELDLVVTGENGDVSVGTVPVFTSSDPVKIGDSIISVTSSRVVIDGDLSFDSITSGSINASLIDDGTMSIQRLNPGGDNYILQTVGGVVQWRNLSDLTIGTASNATNSVKVKIDPITVSDEYRLVLRNNNSPNNGSFINLYSHSNGLKFKSDGTNLRILAHNGGSSNPPYSFEGSPTTGMYRIDGVDSAIGFSVNGNQRLRIDGTGLKTISGSVTKPSYSWVNNTNTGMYRIDVDKIGFSIGGYRRLWVENDFIGFGDSNNGSPIVRTNNNTLPTSPSYTWFGNSNTGMYRPDNNQIGFSISGQQTVKITSSYINFGIDGDGSPRIRTGNNTLPTSPSYTWGGNDQTGIYRPDQDVIGFSTSGTERVRIDNNGTTVNNNFYLPSPNGSVPVAGKILTAFDVSGKSEWSSLYSNFIQTGFHGFYKNTSPTSGSEDIKGKNEDYLLNTTGPFMAPFTGYYQITMSINTMIDFSEGGPSDRNMQFTSFMVKTSDSPNPNTRTELVGVQAGIMGRGLESSSTGGGEVLDRFWDTQTLTWSGFLWTGEKINPKIERNNEGSVTSFDFYYNPTNNVVGSHLSWVGIKST